jgi:tetratricopeptide (TPR) repeat protein
MAGDREGAARRAQEGIAVSSGDSSAATPKPALDSDGMTMPGVGAADVTLSGTDEPATPPKGPVSPSAPKSGPSDAATIVGTGSSGGDSSSPNPIFSHIGATVFHDGDILGGRYEIQKMLGMGGMGAVYKARDMEVERVVGLKVIRPDLAGNPAILARFKQELVLARQVTHKNIIRIYDLNEADGVKFITMEFIEGEDLRSILTSHGKLPPEEAAGIILQVCAGLQAAHGEGVIHRDLKPSNIMRDPAGRVVIMDFGLARTVQGDGMTQTGMMVGTMEYMSPEQAMGKDLDARSDQFAVGLIFYEMLSGFIPFHAESAIASLVKRTQEAAVPLVDVDTSIPPVLSHVVSKCLERDPNARFASLQQLIDELEVWQGKKSRLGQSAFASYVPSGTVPTKQFAWKWVAIGIAGIVLVAGTYFAVHTRTSQGTSGTGSEAVQGPVMSVAVLPFHNGSGDPNLNWIGFSISDNLISEIGGSTHLHLVSAGRLQDVLRDLGFSPGPQLDASTLRSIQDAVSADTVISGQLVKAGDQFRINATVHDLKNGRDIPVTTDLANVKDLAGAMDKLAGQIREKLAATPDILNELRANSGHVLTNSVTALQSYDEGLQLTRAGNNTQAVIKFEKATGEDPNFAMAFAKLADTYSALHYGEKAEQASRRAVELSENLPAQDRYLIQAINARITNDTKKAIAAYENLTKLSPDDTDAQSELAGLYERTNNFDEAKKRLAQVLAIDPKNIKALRASGRVEIEAGNSQAALEPLAKALSLATLSGNEEEKGSILFAIGAAYHDLDKPADALANFQQSLEIRKKIADQGGIAQSLGQVARMQDRMGQSAAALASYNAALEVDRKISDKYGLLSNLINLGTFYHDHGKYDQALKSGNEALQLARELQAESDQALCLNNIGSAYNNKGEYQAALTYFQQAYEIRDRLKLPAEATESLRNLAEMNFKLGEYDTAQTQFLKALEASRKANDKEMLALESSTMGVLFAAQGKYDSALSYLQQAVDGFKQINNRTWYSVEALARYGDVLSIVGRGAEGQKSIDDALKLAEEVKDESATAEARNDLGDSYFCRGDYSSTRQQYERARQVASKWALPDQSLRARLGLAKVDLEQGRAKTAMPELKKLQEEARSKGLKALAVQASISYAQALLATNNADAARQELESALGQTDKMSMWLERARAEYLLGNALTRTGRPKEAPLHYREAERILDSIIAKEKSAAHILERPDLKNMYSEAKSYQGGAA